MATSLAERARRAEPEYVQVNVRMEIDLKQRLVALAESERISLTDLIRVACEDALEKYKPPPRSRRRGT
jgi:predicted HicB family RNase H-like nuclease